MDNPSLHSLSEKIAESLTALGLHAEGGAAIQGAIHKDDFSEEDDDEEEYEMPDVGQLVDAVKAEKGHAVIHMNFAVNKLAWTDRVLHPDTYIDPQTVEDLDGVVMTKDEERKAEIAARLEAGEDLEDILADLFGDDDDD